MDGREFQDCLDRIGISQKQYAGLAELESSTLRRRKVNQSAISTEAAILLRLLAERPELLPLAWAKSGLPEGVEHLSPAGRPPLRD